MKLEYFDPRIVKFTTMQECADECSSCGKCRDCGLCESICPMGAISRNDLGNNEFEMVSDPEKCIGCGFCANACPLRHLEHEREHAPGLKAITASDITKGAQGRPL